MMKSISVKISLFLVSLCLTISVNAQWSQLGLDIDGEAAGDNFGKSVSTSADGLTIAAGGHFNDGGGSNTGHVRVYKLIGGVWTQQGLDIEGKAIDDQSGKAISLSSDGLTVAIGAEGAFGAGSGDGLVSIYKLIGGVWVQQGLDIIGEAASDRSGSSVSLSSDGLTVAIGAVHNDGGGSNAGQVRVYKLIGGVWVKQGLDIDGEAASDNSGGFVSLSSDGLTVAIGGTTSDGGGNNAGHVRVYKLTGGVWIQQGLDIDGEAAGDQSGKGISLSSDGLIVAVGAPYNDGGGNNATGHVRVYKLIGGVWIQQGLDIDGEAVADISGQSVSLSSDGLTVAIGAINNDGAGYSAGHVRIYKLVGGVWVQQGLDIDGEAVNDWSGSSVSLSANGLIVTIAAIGNDDGGSGSGHVRVYQLCTNPDTVSITANNSVVCLGDSVKLTLVGNLNSATQWKVYTGSCDGILIDSTIADSISVKPSVTTTYYIKGEGGCITPGVCDSITIYMDTTSPTASCQDITVYLDGTGNASIIASDLDNGSSDNCGIPSLSTSQTSFTCANVGPNNVTLTATDGSSNSSTCISSITVLDTTSPTASCQDITVYLDGTGNASIIASDLDNGSSDNCGIPSLSASQTSFTCANVGPNNVTLTATDGSSNSSTCISSITVLDTTSPTASCQDITVYLDGTGNASIIASDLDNGSSDNCGIPSLSASQASFTCANVGPNNVTLTATDGSSNSSTCISSITVLDTITRGSLLIEAVCDNYNFGGNNLTMSGMYYDTILILGGCDSIITLDLTINNCVGIHQNKELKTFEVFPNPTNGIVELNFTQSNFNNKVTYEVITVTGEITLTGYFNESKRQTLNLSDLNNGVYLIRVTNSNEIITKRILLKK
jgi:hypothetical protein